MNAQYLTLIEQLVREDRPADEIEQVVREVVEEDERLLEDEPVDLPNAA